MKNQADQGPTDQRNQTQIKPRNGGEIKPELPTKFLNISFFNSDRLGWPAHNADIGPSGLQLEPVWKNSSVVAPTAPTSARYQ